MKWIANYYTESTPTKDVDYFGLDLKNVKHGWLAVDGNGELHWFETYPRRYGLVDVPLACTWSSRSGMIDYLGTVDLDGVEWRDTLVEVK